MQSTGFSEHWIAKRKASADIIAAGKVTITFKDKRIVVVCPDSDAFRRGATELGGTYRHKTLTWSFRVQASRLVRELVIKCFGEENIQK